MLPNPPNLGAGLCASVGGCSYSVKPTRVQLVIELMQGGSWYDALHCGDRVRR